ncbi:ZIP family metal transporter [Haliea sp. E1-2-M8]|uniref:ZIP family metal transporter n=1 Tax=Haliea sp. E1-2-M8 TaxID=3064706 RepID=UPI00271805F7|nr:ZIP family metal transporter [Haliea sp. E1-2-M8]MDO8860624.1 ZIP family metal transporter [Haliea sp. E1-2-M8]
MSPEILLTVYCVAIALLSLAGGLLPNWVRMTHTRTQLVMSFVSGLMLGVAFYHLLPHSIALQPTAQGVDRSVWWLMIGLITMLMLLRMFHFHQHDFSAAEAGHHAQHAHGDEHGGEGHHHPDAATPAAHRLSWVGLALGLGVHTLIDGVALGAAMQGELGQTAGLLGVGVFLAILLHKPLDAMSITTIMEAGGWNRRSRALANIGFALLCPLGALLFYFGVDLLGDARHYTVAIALAFSAGAFICIALSDLLPEVHFHSHDRGKLTLAFVAGIMLAYAIGVIEPASAHLHGG